MESQYLNRGTKLQNGKYVIADVIGQGGFGITYKAIMKESASGKLGAIQIDVPVAVKEFFMSENCMRDEKNSHVSVPSIGSRKIVEQYHNKFVKEANNLASLSHPNIVKVIDVFNENGTDYYVMEYLEGGTLKDLVKKNGALDEQTALRYISLIGEALSYMHTQKHMCHFDVKPGNILLDKNGVPKLIDFGISKNYDAKGNETSNTPVGISKGFAPLEQYQQSVQEFSPQTDVYALGATLYYLLTGSVPPEASIVFNSGLPPFPSNVSTGVKSAVQSAMQARKTDRPQTMAAFLQLLANDDDETLCYKPEQENVEKHPIEESPAKDKNNPAEISKSEPKNPLNKAIIAIIGIAVMIIIGVGYWLFNNSSSPTTDEQEITEELTLKEVQNQFFNSEIGVCSYTGTVDEEGLPHGRGVAEFSDGRKYNGPFNHGTLEGEDAYFDYGNGDIFEGSFEKNSFKEGKYTKKDGTYYQGTFANGNTNKGQWFSKDGKLIN